MLNMQLSTNSFVTWLCCQLQQSILFMILLQYVYLVHNNIVKKITISVFWEDK